MDHNNNNFGKKPKKMRRYREKIKDDPSLVISQIVYFRGRNEVFRIFHDLAHISALLLLIYFMF